MFSPSLSILNGKREGCFKGKRRGLRLSGAWDCEMERPDSQKCLFQTFGGSSFVSPGREAEHENDLPKAIRESALDETVNGGPQIFTLVYAGRIFCRG